MSNDTEEASARWQEGHNHDKIKSHTLQVSDPQTGHLQSLLEIMQRKVCPSIELPIRKAVYKGNS